MNETYEEITLRPIEKEDLVFLRDLANDPGVRANVVGWDWPLSLAAQERWYANGVDNANTRRFIVQGDDGKPVGLTGLWDIDWHNRTAMSAIKIGGKAEYRGRGYGTRALEAIMEFAFNDVGLNRLYAQILEFNSASLSLYSQKFGWSKEGVFRQHVWRDGKYWDVATVGILRDEYIRRRANQNVR